MESSHSPKKPGAARAGVLAAFLLLVLLLALPCAWYAVYHDQMTTPAAGPMSPTTAASSRPSGVITLPAPIPGQIRTVRIQHTGGQVVTNLCEGGMTLTMSSPDPRPPSNPLDALGQSLCDRYNAWKCEKGDFQQSAGVIQVPGSTSTIRAPRSVSIHGQTISLRFRSTLFVFTGDGLKLPLAHASGTRAPGSFPSPAAHTPARP